MPRQVIRSNPSNPNVLLGEDPWTLVQEGLGAAGTQAVNVGLVNPLLGRLIPMGGDAGMKVVDVITTGISAAVLGIGVGALDSSIGRRARRGGVLLTLMKAVTIPFPQISFSANITGLPFPQIGGVGNNNGRKALPPAQSIQAAQPLAEARRSVLDTGL